MTGNLRTMPSLSVFKFEKANLSWLPGKNGMMTAIFESTGLGEMGLTFGSMLIAI